MGQRSEYKSNKKPPIHPANRYIQDKNVRVIPWMVSQICSRWGEWNDYLTRVGYSGPAATKSNA